MECTPAVDVPVIDVYVSRYQQFSQFEVPGLYGAVEGGFEILIIFDSRIGSCSQQHSGDLNVAAGGAGETVERRGLFLRHWNLFKAIQFDARRLP